MARNRWRTAFGSALAAALIAGVTVGAGAAYAADAPIPADAIVDQFDKTSLAGDWSVVNSDPTQWSLSERPGHLRIHSLKGDTWQTANDAKNVFLQDIPSGDFQLVAKFDAPVALDYQSAGLLAWQDTDNYVRAGLAHVGSAGGTVIENAREAKAAFTSTFTARAGSTAETLKLSRAGNLFTTSYWNGSAWVQAAKVTVDLDVQKVGIYAFSAVDGTSLSADFDYLAVVPPESRAVVPTDPFTVDTGATFLAANAKGAITASTDRSMTQLVVRAVEASGDTVAMQDLASGRYLEVTAGKQVHLAAKSSAAGQRFRLIDAAGGRVRVSGSTGYLTVAGRTLTTTSSISSAPRWHVRPYRSAIGELRVNAGAAGKRISDRLHGIFFEDINQAADGGLYAELTRNRSFEFDKNDKSTYTAFTGWEQVKRGGASGTIEVATDKPLNDKNLHYLRLGISAAGAGSEAGLGVRNGGFNTGIAVRKGDSYDFSVWARTTASGGTPITVRAENVDGATVYGTTSVTATGNDWKKYTATLTATGTTTTGRLAVLAGGTGTVDLDMVSLFPKDTFKGRPNGMRKDIAKVIDDLHPRFLRFPGGCVVNTRSYDRFPARQRVYQWKDTVGPVEQRPTNANFWGYNQTYGMGYYEYFQFAEDLGAVPLAVVPVGVTGCGDNHDLPVEKRAEYVQDTLDLIEFANGDASTTWGAKRVAMGHPKPFGLKYLEIGNEEYKDGFYTNFPYFANAIRAKYPDVKIISNSGVASSGDVFDKSWKFAREQKVDVVDEHYYNSPDWFLTNSHRYDNYDRSGPKVFIGEYASKGNTYYNAVAEAAYLTGVERNGDVVELAAYAPLLATPDNVQWTPDMIWFDNHRVYGSANYYVQKMFTNNLTDTVLPSTFEAGDGAVSAIAGKVGLASWNTKVVYDDVKVTDANGKEIFADDFAAGAGKWTPETGTWAGTDGTYVQSSTATPAKSTAGNADWSNYTLEVKARKTAGAEGFLVAFGVKDTGNYYWWNLGGWGNTRSAIQKTTDGSSTEIANGSTTIESNRDYKIKIEVRGRTIRTYLDGQKVDEVVDSVQEPLYQVSTRDSKTGDVIVKVVNAKNTAVRTSVKVDGRKVHGTAAVTSLTASARTDANSFDEPTTVAPKQLTQSGFGNQFTYDFPADSVTFIRFGAGTSGPSPSPSTSPSPSPTASATPGTPTATPSSTAGPGKPGGGGLPTTGSPIVWIAAFGAAMLCGGVLLYLTTRRRRNRLTTGPDQAG
jgi:LPXTG-motif cell wall-anchored protein